MIDYDNKEERKVLREALAKYFPLDSIKVVIQKNSYLEEMSVKRYFDTLTGICGNVTLFVKGKYGWNLCVDIDVVGAGVRITRIHSNITNFNSVISYCSLWMDSWDPIDMFTNLFNRRKPEYLLAKHLFKLAKEAYIRISKGDRAKKIKALKDELL